MDRDEVVPADPEITRERVIVGSTELPLRSRLGSVRRTPADESRGDVLAADRDD